VLVGLGLSVLVLGTIGFEQFLGREAHRNVFPLIVEALGE
jgi:hypothetical protein